MATSDPAVLLGVRSGMSPWIDIARGAADEIRRSTGWRIILHLTDAPLRPGGLIRGRIRLVGAICRMGGSIDQEALDRLGCPAVVVSNNGTPHRCPRVGVDETAVGRLAARHLLGLGLRRFSYANSPAHFSQERGRAFAETVIAAGCDCLIADAHGEDDRRRFLARLTGLAQDGPIGLFAANDGLATSLVHWLLEAGLPVPERVAVLGVDDSADAQLAAPMPLSTIPLPGERIGVEAAHLLIDLVGGAQPPITPLLIPPALVLTRRSTDLTAGLEPRVAAALRFTAAHAHRNFAAAEVVAAAGCGRRTLEIVFRTTLGRTLQAEIRRAHVERALTLLATTDLPLAGVAAASGFSSPQRLSTVIREETGRQAGAFRRQPGLRG